jgi:hypothetical protein
MPDQGDQKMAEATTPASVSAAPGVPSAVDNKKKTEQINRGRRRIAWAFIWGYLGVNLLMFLRFFFPRALYEPNTVFNIGIPPISLWASISAI